MPKGKVVQITKNPRERLFRSLLRTSSLGIELLKQGWAISLGTRKH